MHNRAYTVYETLSLTTPDISPLAESGFTNGLCWAQTVARSQGTVVGSVEYFDAMSSELGRIGWNVVEADNVELQIHQNRISPAQIVDSLLTDQVSAEFADRTAELFRVASGTGAASKTASDFLTDWWSSTNTSAATTSFLVGPLTPGATTTSTLLWLSMDYSSANWSSLFVEHDTAQLHAQVRKLVMSFVPGLWKPIESQVIDKLGSRALDFIHHIDLDL